MYILRTPPYLSIINLIVRFFYKIYQLVYLMCSRYCLHYDFLNIKTLIDTIPIFLSLYSVLVISPLEPSTGSTHINFPLTFSFIHINSMIVLYKSVFLTYIVDIHNHFFSEVTILPNWYAKH